MANGDICHIELHTPDIEASRKFYEALFAWTFEITPGFETYAIFRTPSGLGGGFDAGPNADPPSRVGPVIHIEVDDIEGVLGGIGEHGGETLVGKTKISDEFGFFAVFLDNVGNRMALWSPK